MTIDVDIECICQNCGRTLNYSEKNNRNSNILVVEECDFCASNKNKEYESYETGYLKQIEELEEKYNSLKAEYEKMKGIIELFEK